MPTLPQRRNIWLYLWIWKRRLATLFRLAAIEIYREIIRLLAYFLLHILYRDIYREIKKAINRGHRKGKPGRMSKRARKQ